MTDEINTGASAPVPEPNTRILDASALDARPAPQPAVPAPAPLEGDALRISQLETQINALEQLKDEADTGSKRRDYDAQIRALVDEKAKIQLRDVLEAPEKESAPAPPEDTIAPYALVPKQYQALGVNGRPSRATQGHPSRASAVK